MNKKSILFLLILTTSCGKCPEKVPPFTKQEFPGRAESIGENVTVHRPVYRAKVPQGWVRIDSAQRDTTEPNVSFLIDEAIKITVHTFPSESLSTRIPPAAQIERWKRQIGDASTLVKSASRGGFAGLSLEGPNLLAWSMQLDPEHYQTLSFVASTPLEEEHFKQMCADYTIKITGPQELIEKHRKELLLFVNSFELIQEIPKRT